MRLGQIAFVQEIIGKEIDRLINAKNGFRRIERVHRFALLGDDFRVGEELTHTLKMKRIVIAEKYRKLIESLYEG